jgi:hypothetical protein
MKKRFGWNVARGIGGRDLVFFLFLRGRLARRKPPQSRNRSRDTAFRA